MKNATFIVSVCASATAGIAAAFFVAFLMPSIDGIGEAVKAAGSKIVQTVAGAGASAGSESDLEADDNRPVRIDKGVIAEDRPELNKEGKTIVADLSEMKMKLYEDGEEKQVFDIQSKGKPGSPWETPPGEYAVEYKTANHLSSIGGVYMPYSMQFFGNYFIHGWPYYASGERVPEGFSGGCIRLADIDAEQVFDFVDVGTTVIVRGGVAYDNVNAYATTTNDITLVSDSTVADDVGLQYSGSYFARGNAKLPKITAKSYLVADIETGDIILEKFSETQRPIASLSKFMTALVSLEAVNQFKEVVVSQDAVDTYGAAGDLYAQEILMVRDVLYPLLLESSNDAAEVIAEQIGRSHFVSLMNKKAESIGLDDTSFDDPSGLSYKNVSTARDLFKLTQYLYKYKHYVIDVTTRKEQEVGDKVWLSNSRFKNDANYLGGKNGYIDESGHTLIALFGLDLAVEEEDERVIAIILLDSKNKEEDARALQSYLKSYVYYSR